MIFYAILTLVFVAACVELFAWEKVWGGEKYAAQPEVAPVVEPQRVFKEYSAAEIRVMEKEAQYQRELRAEQMGYCLLPRQGNFRNLPENTVASV